MIDEKKIEEATDIYVDKCIERYEEGKSGECCKTLEQPPCFGEISEAFKAGINWFLGNLWHDAYEKPKEDACIIVQSNLGGEYYTSVYSNGEFECDSFHLLHKEITRWLYIEDLMKGGK